MKRIDNLYNRIISAENLILADKKARKGKLRQCGVVKHIENEKENISILHELLDHRKFKTSEYKIFKIYEGKEFTIEQLKELINKNEDKLEAVELYLDIYKKSRL